LGSPLAGCSEARIDAKLSFEKIDGEAPMGRLQFTLFGNTIDINAPSKIDGEVDESVPDDEAVEEREQIPAGGPGFFDSSFDLLRGLDVREGPPGDPKLNEWLENFVSQEKAATFDVATIESSSDESDSPQTDDFSAYGIEGLELL
jgi:hypothetical protein